MSFLWFLSEMRVPVLNYILLAISYIGTPFAVVGIISWFYWNVNKKMAYGISFSFYVSCLLCQGIKIIARVPRPWLLDSAFKAVEAAIPSAGGYSFPSIHTESSTALFVSLSLYYKKKNVRALCLGLLFLIAFSRMYLGCHTPLDVGCAFAITLVITLFIFYFWGKYGDSTHNDALLAFFLGAFAVALLILAGTLLGNGTVDFSNAKDSFETAGIALGFCIGFPMERKFVNFSEEGTVKEKIIRYLCGLAVALVIEFAFKLISNTNLFLLVFRYALNGLWLTCLWPIIFTNIKEKKPGTVK